MRNPIGKKHRAGFSLVELMIALALGSLVGTALLVLFSESLKSREQIDRAGKKLESGRQALEVIADDLRLAGYYGEYAPGGETLDKRLSEITYRIPDPFVATVSTAADLGWNNTATTDPVKGPTIPVPVFGYEAHTTAVAAPSVLTNYLGGDILVVRRLYTQTTAPADAAGAANTWFFQPRLCGNSSTSPEFIVSKGGAGNFPLLAASCTTGTQAAIRRLVVRVYYIASCDNCTTNDGIPTLKVYEPIDGGVVRSLAPGIENMHLEYGVDANSDGSADGYYVPGNAPATLYSDNAAATVFFDAKTGTPAPAVNCTDPVTLQPLTCRLDWRDVMSVKVHLLARDANTTPGYVDSKQYVLGELAAISPGGAYKRKVFSSTVRLNNPSSRREIPWKP